MEEIVTYQTPRTIFLMNSENKLQIRINKDVSRNNKLLPTI